MPRKLALAATFACAALYLCAVAAPVFAAEVAAAGGKAVVLPWGDLVVAFGNEVAAILVPILVANSDFTTHFVSLTLLAGLMHMAGPEAINGRVPTREWVRIGALAAAGLGLVFALAFYGLALRGD